jgi:hypothetical protein
MTEGGGTKVGHGPPKIRKKKIEVQKQKMYSLIVILVIWPFPKNCLALFLDFMAISNKFFLPYS